MSAVSDRIERHQPLLIGVVNTAKIVNMQRDPALRQAVLESDLIVADGMGVVWGCLLLGRRLPERVPGIDLMHALLAKSAERGFRVFCLGATQEVLDTAVARMEEMYPDLVIAGRHHGYFKAGEEEVVAELIRESKSDILFVAMTSPKKEQFLERWSPRMDVPVCHGVGGSFDVLAGKVKRAPRIWQRLGVEWLYRVIQEPRRMWRRYLVTNTLFAWMLLREFFTRRDTKRALVGGGTITGANEAGSHRG